MMIRATVGIGHFTKKTLIVLESLERIASKVLKDDDADFQYLKRNIGLELSIAGDHSNGIRLLDEGYDWLRAHSDNDPLQFRRKMEFAASRLLTHKQFVPAIRYYKILKDEVIACDDECLTVAARIFESLGDCYFETEDYASSEENYRLALTRIPTDSELNNITGTLKGKLASCLFKQKTRHTEIEQLLLQAHKILHDTKTPDLLRVSTVEEQLVDLYETLGKIDMVEKWRSNKGKADI